MSGGESREQDRSILDYQLAAWLDDREFRILSGPCVYLLNGQNGLRRIGNSSGLRCPADASLGSITLRNDSARTLAMVKWDPLRHPMVKPYPRRPHENYLYLPYKSLIFGPMPGPAAPGHARRLKWHALPSIETALAPSPIKVHWPSHADHESLCACKS